jgi:hypothetical protein
LSLSRFLNKKLGKNITSKLKARVTPKLNIKLRTKLNSKLNTKLNPKNPTGSVTNNNLQEKNKKSKKSNNKSKNNLNSNDFEEDSNNIIRHGLNNNLNQASSRIIKNSSSSNLQSRNLNFGLKEISKKVKEIVRKHKRTTYKIISDLIISEINEKDSKDEKNIRRRIYDSLNVMKAMNLFKKDPANKYILWNGENEMIKNRNSDSENYEEEDSSENENFNEKENKKKKFVTDNKIKKEENYHHLQKHNEKIESRSNLNTHINSVQEKIKELENLIVRKKFN